MNRRDLLKIISKTAVPAAASFLLQCRGGELSQKKRPNIVLIMVDDMGFSDLGCYGSEIDTPNLDRLAAGGLRFTQFYNAARCCPTRASLLTGLYPHQAGMGAMIKRDVDLEEEDPYQGYLSRKSVTIAEVLKNSGYKTAMSGKWHVGETRPNWPTDRGFDRYFGLISGASNYFDPRRDKPGAKRIMALGDQTWNPPEDGFYMTDAITDYAVRYLEAMAGQDVPFFLYVGYTAPHYPLHAHESDIQKFRRKYLKGWETLRRERFKRQIEIGLFPPDMELSPKDEDALTWEDVEDKDAADLKMAIYAAQVHSMDRGIGELLDVLDKSAKLDDTLILFLSDNGASNENALLGTDFRNSGYPPGHIESYWSYGLCWANASNTPFRYYKKWINEGGITTPLIVHWPSGISARGKITSQMGHIIDVMATCCEVAGAQYPKIYNGNEIRPLQGKSLIPVFEGRKRDYSHPVFWEHYGRKAVRTGKWKLVLKEPDRWELYDMERDRTELNDLASRYPERVSEMLSLYQRWAEGCGVRDRKPPPKRI